MLRSYLAIAVRQLLAQKLYTAINVAGLALGLACALLIALFVRHELSYDRQFANSGRIVGSPRTSRVDPPHALRGRRRRRLRRSAGFLPRDREGRAALELLRCRRRHAGHGRRAEFVEPRLMAADNEFFEIFDFAGFEATRARRSRSRAPSS